MPPNNVWYIDGPGNTPIEVDFGTFANDCDEVVEAADLVKDFSLGNAYPNPFNPTTTIQFSLAETEYIQLTVFNIAGQSIASLADGIMDTGDHRLTFDASGLESGVYFYSLQAGEFIETKKMVFVK